MPTTKNDKGETNGYLKRNEERGQSTAGYKGWSIE
jgi:hypothetical protein